jgi:hypothetical protein
MKKEPIASFGLALAIALWASAVAAQTVQIAAGTGELVSARECTVLGASGCDEIGPATFQYGGLAGDTASAAELIVPGFGEAFGSVSLSGVAGAPIIATSARSETGKRMSTNTVALQRYTYEGELPTLRVFGGTLTYSQLLTGSYPSDVGGGIGVTLRVFTLTTDTIAVPVTTEGNFAMLFSDVLLEPGLTMLGTASYRSLVSTAAGLATVEVPVALNPGDVVWVQAVVQTPATNGGWVDSSQTFITGWDDPVSLMPAAVVPEPRTLALWLLGLSFVVWRRRRSQASMA